jgi:glucose/arabinose dehydrogenase
MTKISKNQLGNLQVLILVVILVAGLLAVAWVVHERSSEQSQLTLANKANVNYKSLSSKDIAKLRTNNSTPAPASAAETSPAPQPSPSPSPQSKSAVTPTVSASPTSTPLVSNPWKISFSSDGCTVTVVADPGASVEIGAHTATKGGSVQYTVPASGTLTKSSGGFKGMTSYAKASNANNNSYSETTITVDQCAPAG